jgi:hypothetical protein
MTALAVIVLAFVATAALLVVLVNLLLGARKS